MSNLIDFLDAESCLQREDAVWKSSALEAGRSIRQSKSESEPDFQRRLATDVGLRREAVSAWLKELRENKVRLPGASMVQSYSGMGWLAVGLGLLIGYATTQGALAASEGTPINLWLFLGVMIFLQIGLLIAALGFAAWAKFRGQVWLGFLGRLSQGFLRWKWARRLDEEDVLGALAETSKVERWIWLALTQRFAVFFNLGAILAFISLLLFSELQFGWSTTPENFKPSLLEGVVNILAAPWAWATPDSWIPTSDFIAGTRWDALSGSFHLPDIDGRRWWPFLFMTLAVWGLLPRVFLWIWMKHREQKAFAALNWNHREYQHLFEVMFPQQATKPRAPISIAAPIPAAPKAKAKEKTRAKSDTVSKTATKADSRLCVLWGDWASSLDLEVLHADGAPLDHLGLTEAELFRCGTTTTEIDPMVLAKLAKLSPSEVWFLVEAGESPDKRCTSFLVELRSKLGQDCPLQILLLEYRSGEWPAVNARDLEVWTRTLDQIHDRHLFVRQIASS